MTEKCDKCQSHPRNWEIEGLANNYLTTDKPVAKDIISQYQTFKIAF